ncbi:cell envelope integrity protein TolA [Bermanella marisrubri]|uniref:Protein TolA n=1 Tax=Bermanella marisrubri TaxID=207949 RepID=Q1N0T3_9GAMM|nr:cell envelope integrity protein TolA [Bermanella marisrubri]EAT11750.1 hypothetical protein RED65_05169 [Oceanobacter sp. RED65] [Bermanella marisrubri]QIZ83786.1 cell envelope integrity protein TolA [Bermanella marisrubri]
MMESPRLHFFDPRSFTIPSILSGTIVLSSIILLLAPWSKSEPMVYKTPKHVSATLVQLDKPKPKKVVKKPKPKPKPVQKPKVESKPKTNQEKAKPAKPKPAEKPEAKINPQPIEDNFAEQLAQEESQRELERLMKEEEAAKQAEQEQEAVNDYTSQIVGLIQSVWRFPPSAKHDQVVMLKVFLVPTGEVTEVQLLESSGNPALDRSAEQAVWKVGKLPVPDDVVLFEKQFRQIILKLQPENARL